MKKIVSTIWIFIKEFPLATYVILGANANLMWYFFKIQYDSAIGVLIMIIFAPIIFMSDFFDSIFFREDLYGSLVRSIVIILVTMIFFFILDLLILSIRKGHLKSIFKKIISKLTTKSPTKT